ncbi:acyl-CoA carboxylase epsilon subunit [Agromyces sp. ZXT2-6]|uniref:acyl-CoA carboxylase epsilon subunit n=1 Tax=Agromyces sp. ZXT2-6 TaxID=3461153 RepID=UPI004055276C
MTTASGEPNGAESLDLRFLTRDVSAEEAAAVTAVIVAAVREERATPPPPARSAWAHPRHALRPPIEVGPGRWSSAPR